MKPEVALVAPGCLWVGTQLSTRVTGRMVIVAVDPETPVWTFAVVDTSFLPLFKTPTTVFTMVLENVAIYTTPSNTDRHNFK